MLYTFRLRQLGRIEERVIPLLHETNTTHLEENVFLEFRHRDHSVLKVRVLKAWVGLFSTER